MLKCFVFPLISTLFTFYSGSCYHHISKELHTYISLYAVMTRKLNSIFWHLFKIKEQMHTWKQHTFIPLKQAELFLNSRIMCLTNITSRIWEFFVWITMKRLIIVVYCCSLWSCTTFLYILALIVFYSWVEHLKVLQSIFKLSGLTLMQGTEWLKYVLSLCLELRGLGNRSLALQKKVTLNCNYCISRVVIVQNPTPG